MGLANTYAPQVRPHLWLKLHALVFVYSLALLIVNTFFTEDSKGVKFAEASYLYYSCITTIIWASFVGLEIAFDHWDFSGWEKEIEFILAIVFTALSLSELWEWKVNDQNIYFMELEFLLNTLTYGYESRKSFQNLGYETVGEGEASASLAV